MANLQDLVGAKLVSVDANVSEAVLRFDNGLELTFELNHVDWEEVDLAWEVDEGWEVRQAHLAKQAVLGV